MIPSKATLLAGSSPSEATFFFAWHGAASLLLDWYHVVKKFREELSLACTGREIRNRHVQTLLRLLWFGLLDRAIDYLQFVEKLLGLWELPRRMWILIYVVIILTER
jgi:hypothetical protein